MAGIFGFMPTRVLGGYYDTPEDGDFDIDDQAPPFVTGDTTPITAAVRPTQRSVKPPEGRGAWWANFAGLNGMTPEDWVLGVAPRARDANWPTGTEAETGPSEAGATGETATPFRILGPSAGPGQSSVLRRRPDADQDFFPPDQGPDYLRFFPPRPPLQPRREPTPFEAAAQRTQQTVQPQDGRREGKMTEVGEKIGGYFGGKVLAPLTLPWRLKDAMSMTGPATTIQDRSLRPP
jgi:hypothetical protein